MIEIHYTFTVLQYRHDAWSGEALNVGVLLAAQDVKFVSMKVTGTDERIVKAYPGVDAFKVRNLLKAIEFRIRSVSSRAQRGLIPEHELIASAIAKNLLPDDDSALRWLDPGAGVTTSPSEELDLLYSRYVSRWEAQSETSAGFEDDLFRLRNEKLDVEYKWILRALYYKQSLPNALLAQGHLSIERRMNLLELAGLLEKTPERPRLTSEGVRALRKAYGANKPPLIDFKQDARLPGKGDIKEFIVGSSLASSLAREVSTGE
ncbi:DUF3037 domain-containing protein [Salipiger sp. IMCC34102]|uniref:DUF3037 domain-containing protein n=1 Tax=Salipiger sp. IMCC34102 TaxID=2510647 RepID=UPI00101C1762|nr:DUF3037 domain-containing protein [Salipiger sp. IMCC34102]RYH00810.1 DUF3037 domain-containing protein [Salipiger sp. IMCC34102]